MQKELAPEFTHLVDWSVTELGKVIQQELGKASFNRIEKIRRHIKSKQGSEYSGLMKLKFELERLPADEQFHVAHAFALMLELINACEAAYRIHRLQQDDHVAEENHKHVFGRIIHVLTAHPTESRNPAIIFYFKKIQNLLVSHLGKPDDQDTEELHRHLSMAWKIPMSKQRKPSVMDEAEYIYSLVLQDEIMELYIRERRRRMPFYIRSWVGGDKDGHPGVNEKTLLGSLQMSRVIILKWLVKELNEFLHDLEPMARTSFESRRDIAGLLKDVKKAKAFVVSLKRISAGDSRKVRKLELHIREMDHAFRSIIGARSESLDRIIHIWKVFPGLVVPLEIREDSSLVHQALRPGGDKLTIARMIATLGKISPEHDPRNYVRGFVLSHTESAKDIQAGIRLVRKHLGKAQLPVVPLFESADALENSVDIITEFLKTAGSVSLVRNRWSSQLEVMLGYSDSMKENGSFPSRFLIQSAISGLEKSIQRHGITPIFFHGSGGSVERGGGSIQEQTEWWPVSALATVKMTMQGEVIYRNYTAPELLKRHADLIVQTRDERRLKKAKATDRSSQKALAGMAAAIQKSYRDILNEPEFLELIEHATPYSYLKDLRFGSRPAKRQGSVQLANLRAIPWVLCWTQNRVLFPSWWGVGTHWKNLRSSERNALRKAFNESALFRSYIKVLGFTLQKIEMNVFRMYLECSVLSEDTKKDFISRFEREYELCRKCVQEITGKSSLLWYRPWLETSIQLRSPLIHPLNVLQLIALKNKNIHLLRETVTGVASGMLTTG